MEYKNYDTIYMCGYTFGGKYCPLFFVCADFNLHFAFSREQKTEEKMWARKNWCDQIG